MEQRFTLPGLPLHRELQAPVTIGTQFSVRATPIQHDKNTVTLTLVTDKSEAALEITIFLPDKHGRGAKLRAISRSATSESSPLEKEVSTLAVNKELILGVIVKEHVFEIYLDTVFLLPFVHRLNPSEITKLVLDGAMICNEVVVVPVKTDMPPLPQYNEVSLNRQQTLPPPPQQQQLLQPQPAPRAPPVGAVPVLPPYPAGTAGQLPGSIAKPPEPVWQPAAAPQQAQPLPMPQPQRVAPPMQQAAAAAQLPPPLPPRAVPTTSSAPQASPVQPLPYGLAPLPPQAYPHNPAQPTAPQFQNIQNIPGLSYPTGQQPQQQLQPVQQQQQQMQQTPQQYPPQQPYPTTYQPYPGYYTASPYGGAQYPAYPVSPSYPSPYTVQYPAPYPAYSTVYMNDHCHYNYWHHHHHHC